MTKSNEPNSASLISRDVLIVGIREAQEEKQRPERKKNALIAIRCFVFNSMNLSKKTPNEAVNVSFFL